MYSKTQQKKRISILTITTVERTSILTITTVVTCDHQGKFCFILTIFFHFSKPEQTAKYSF